MRKLLRLALLACKRSMHPRHKMGAVVLNGRKIVSVACNSHKWGDHAEIRALKKATGDKLIVVRDGMRMSKPCEICRHVIKMKGIREITYVDWTGNIITERA